MRKSEKQDMNYLSLNVLYDNSLFIVVHTEYMVPARRVREVGFELVDKNTSRSVFLVAEEAAAFKARIAMWQAATPQASEVDETIESFMFLSQTPILYH